MVLEFLKGVFKRKHIAEQVSEEIISEMKEPQKKYVIEYFAQLAKKESMEYKNRWKKVFDNHMQSSVKEMIAKAKGEFAPAGFAMDSSDVSCENYAFSDFIDVCDPSYRWYASNYFRGYPWCAMIFQQWLVNKICRIPAQDAFVDGYEVIIKNIKGIDEDDSMDDDIINEINKIDTEYKILENLEELVTMGRCFGIRVAYFVVNTKNKSSYYENPFNIDGVTPGSYVGISQIDPYNLVPELDQEASSDPSSMHYLEPTWWRVGNLKIHRSHLIVYRTGVLPDMIKPMYAYGGMPITQKIYMNCFQSEKIADIAVMLTASKRSNVIKCDLKEAAMDQQATDQRWKDYIYTRDSEGINLIDLGEEYQQFDTSLTDVVTTQNGRQQLCAADGEIPYTRLFGTSPQGFNSGEYETKSYIQTLKTTRNGSPQKMVTRHHLLVMKSIIEPKYGIFKDVSIQWAELDPMTAKEQAEVNEIDSRSGQNLLQSGAIQPKDERQRLKDTKTSGYAGIVDLNDSYDDNEEDDENIDENEE